MPDDVTVHGKIDPIKQKKIQKLCNKIRNIILEQPSDIIFEALAVVSAIYIKEYIDMALENGVMISEGEVYMHLAKLIDDHLKTAVFIPEQKN